jgi:uncharacterized protein involved in tellurium resistance
MTIIECASTREIPDIAQCYQLGKNETVEKAAEYLENCRKIDKVYHWGGFLYYLEQA